MFTQAECAKREIYAIQRALEENGVDTMLFHETGQHPEAFDSVFPNNWFTTHSSSDDEDLEKEKEKERKKKSTLLVLYPMAAPSRRLEQRPDIIGAVGASRVVDLSSLCQKEEYLEGTGSMVLDRNHCIAYVALSHRSHPTALAAWQEIFPAWTIVSFHAQDAKGRPIYHTNVILSVGMSVAVCCLEAIVNEEERQRLVDSMQTHQQLVSISFRQMEQFCANILQVMPSRYSSSEKHEKERESVGGSPFWIMSTTAYRGLDPAQKQVLSRGGQERLVHVPIPVIEQIGGGSLRCCCAENFTI
jgi:hypothetical protein